MTARPYRARAALAAAGIGLVVAATGCGSLGTGAPGASTGSAHTAPVVFAAASLASVFPKIDPAATFTFGGSGALATQIEQGAPADVFAAASAKQPAVLAAKGLVTPPIEFATNTLVLIVPRGNPAHIGAVADITRPAVKLVICGASVPCGDYARSAFAHLGISVAAMKNVVSQASDVTQVVAEVALGQADAGVVYATDALAAGDKVTAIPLPPAAKPVTRDYITTVKAGAHQDGAAAFVARVLSPTGQAALRAAGFGPPRAR
jgi:molybdate transport system substrate-binding protein